MVKGILRLGSMQSRINLLLGIMKLVQSSMSYIRVMLVYKIRSNIIIIITITTITITITTILILILTITY